MNEKRQIMVSIGVSGSYNDIIRYIARVPEEYKDRTVIRDVYPAGSSVQTEVGYERLETEEECKARIRAEKDAEWMWHVAEAQYYGTSRR